jgi:hypothetical protein
MMNKTTAVRDTLKMEAAGSFETRTNFYQATGRQIPEGSNLQENIPAGNQAPAGQPVKKEERKKFRKRSLQYQNGGCGTWKQHYIASSILRV